MATSLKSSKAVGTARARKKSSGERADPLGPRSIKPKTKPPSKSQPAPAIPAKSRPTSKPAAKRQAGSGPTRLTKSDLVINLLRKPGGASLGEPCTATGWQAHSVRGFLSGALRKKQGLEIESFKTGEGERRYRLATQPK